MKFDQDLCLNLWCELNPRVCCAFGNVLQKQSDSHWVSRLLKSLKSWTSAPRSLVSPLTGHSIFTRRNVGTMLGTKHSTMHTPTCRHSAVGAIWRTSRRELPPCSRASSASSEAEAAAQSLSRCFFLWQIVNEQEEVFGARVGACLLGSSLSGVEVKLAFINPQFWFSRGRAGHYNSKSK